MDIDNIPKTWKANSAATEEAFLEVTEKHSLPSDYIEFLRQYNGGGGFIGKNYLILWRVEKLISFNQEYEVDQYIPGLFMFGSSGGGESYCFDERDPLMPIVRVPFIGMSLLDAQFVASSFTDLINRLEKDDE